MRFSRFTSFFIITCLPLSVFAETGMLDTQETLSKLNLLIVQLEARIKQLQAENTVLRNEMVKAGIKIPLSEFSWATVSIPNSLSSWDSSGSTNQGVPTQPNTDPISSISLQYGKDVAGFISRISRDWNDIRSHYAFPVDSKIAGYEFVQTEASDHVFVDIVIGTGTTGVYDIKILYQFEKTEYKRKLIGIFIYDPKTSRYSTRTGTNPFWWVVRTFVRDPSFAGIVVPPATVASNPSSTTGSTITATGATNAPSQSTGAGVTIAEITKAYNEKRYLSTIALSNTYLESNPATQEILNIRYRTFFIIGKYEESLAEIAKIEKLSTLDKQTACNAQVIATYSKNQSLVDRYTTLCKK